MDRVCIVGGGNVAHSLAAAIARVEPVTVVSRRPGAWSTVLVSEQDGAMRGTTYPVHSTSEMTSVAHARYVFIALPQNAIESIMPILLQCVAPGSSLVFVPAPASIPDYAKKLLGKGVGVAALQRVPFIARIIDYGTKVRMSNTRTLHKVAASGDVDTDRLSACLRKWFGGDVSFLSSFLSLVFSNSNPLLHPSRMVVLFRNWRERTYLRNPLFYGEWTDESSRLYIEADREMLSVMRRYDEINVCTDYESVLSHYQVSSAAELTLKLRSIPSFRQILAPMVRIGGRLIPDFNSRYFTEDVPYGMCAIRRRAVDVGVETPVISRLLQGMHEIVGAKDDSGDKDD